MIVLRLAFGLALLIGLAATSRADDFTDQAALADLFAQLRVARDAQEAQAIDQKIWTVWMTPSDPVLRVRMQEALDARVSGDPLRTLALLNRLVADYPAYAEAWNQRATLYYLVGNFEASIADCAKVLELEPRHFGALAGRALMYLQMDKRPLALRDMATALALHPFLTERQLFPELQQDVTRI
jgi:Flp pilus assembly protein TadD